MKKEVLNLGTNNNLNYIIKGIITSIIFSLLSLIIFAALLTYTNLSEGSIYPVVIILSTLSILIGSSISTIKIKKNGLLNGSIIGATYIFLLYIISSIVNTGFGVNTYTIIMMIAGVLAGIGLLLCINEFKNCLLECERAE